MEIGPWRRCGYGWVPAAATSPVPCIDVENCGWRLGGGQKVRTLPVFLRTLLTITVTLPSVLRSSRLRKIAMISADISFPRHLLYEFPASSIVRIYNLKSTSSLSSDFLFYSSVSNTCAYSLRSLQQELLERNFSYSVFEATIDYQLWTPICLLLPLWFWGYLWRWTATSNSQLFFRVIGLTVNEDKLFIMLVFCIYFILCNFILWWRLVTGRV